MHWVAGFGRAATIAVGIAVLASASTAGVRHSQDSQAPQPTVAAVASAKAEDGAEAPVLRVRGSLPGMWSDEDPTGDCVWCDDVGPSGDNDWPYIVNLSQPDPQNEQWSPRAKRCKRSTDNGQSWEGCSGQYSSYAPRPCTEWMWCACWDEGRAIDAENDEDGGPMPCAESLDRSLNDVAALLRLLKEQPQVYRYNQAEAVLEVIGCDNSVVYRVRAPASVRGALAVAAPPFK